MPSGPQLEFFTEENVTASLGFEVLHSTNNLSRKKNYTAVHCSLLKKSCKCLRMGSKIMFVLNVKVLGIAGGIYWSRTSQAEFDQCFYISQQTAFWLHSQWAWEPGCCWCMVLLERGVSQCYCRAWVQPHCSFSLLLRTGSRNKTLQACIKLGKQVSASMWQVAQPGFWHPKWVLEPAVWELVAAQG